MILRIGQNYNVKFEKIMGQKQQPTNFPGKQGMIMPCDRCTIYHGNHCKTDIVLTQHGTDVNESLTR